MDESREELRRKLRAKIKGKRDGTDNSSGPQLAQRLRSDPQSAMLSMGVDDPEILKQAESIVKNPERFLKDMTGNARVSKPPPKKKNKTPASPAVQTAPTTDANDSDDEEAPPPLP